MIVRREGTSLMTFEPEGDFEYEWLVLNVDAEPYQWLGRTLVCQLRESEELMQAVSDAGFVTEVE